MQLAGKQGFKLDRASTNTADTTRRLSLAQAKHSIPCNLQSDDTIVTEFPKDFAPSLQCSSSGEL